MTVLLREKICCYQMLKKSSCSLSAFYIKMDSMMSLPYLLLEFSNPYTASVVVRSVYVGDEC